MAYKQIQQGEQIQQLQSLVNNYTITVKPYVTQESQFSVNGSDIYPTFHTLLHVITISPHAGYLMLTETGFDLANDSLQGVFNNQNTVMLQGTYGAPVNTGSSDLVFDLTFQSRVYANYQWSESHPQQGIGGYLGWVGLQISFYDGVLHSTTSQSFPICLYINYLGYI